MKCSFAALAAALALGLSSAAAGAQSLDATPPQAAAKAPPTLVRVTGKLATVPGAVRADTILLTLALYDSQEAPTPLWVEQQAVAIDADGRYVAFAGATLPEGLPKEFFTSSAARWLGVTAGSEPEQPRIMLLSVPYALKAGDAETLAGKSPADFVMTERLTDTVKLTLQEQGVRTTAGFTLLASTAGRLAKFSDANGSIADSVITESGGNIGISTATPAFKFEVNGGALGVTAGNLTLANDYNFVWGNGTTLVRGNAATHLITMRPSPGKEATLDANGSLSLAGTAGIGAPATSIPLLVKGTQRPPSLTDGVGYAVFFAPNGYSHLQLGGDSSPPYGSWLQTNNGSGSTQPLLLNPLGGNVGIGTANPTAKLDVNGSINVTGNINAKYQDVAEWVETAEPLAAGTVVIVDPRNPNQVLPSPRAYDTRVAGAVSAQPGLILGERSDTKAMIAQSGRVRVKVDASYGAIRIGDLLVTSPTPGYAMRSKPITVAGQSLHRPGTLLGKALEALPNGKGEILVLLTLQ